MIFVVRNEPHHFCGSRSPPFTRPFVDDNVPIPSRHSPKTEKPTNKYKTMVVGVQQVIPESVPIESFTKLLRPAERRGSKVHTHTYTNIQIAAIIVVHRPTVSTVFYAHSLGFIINVINFCCPLCFLYKHKYDYVVRVCCHCCVDHVHTFVFPTQIRYRQHTASRKKCGPRLIYDTSF